MILRPRLYDTRVQVKMSDVMSALSLALDLVEGQPEGHAVRSCLIGMRLGRDYGWTVPSFQIYSTHS